MLVNIITPHRFGAIRTTQIGGCHVHDSDTGRQDEGWIERGVRRLVAGARTGASAGAGHGDGVRSDEREVRPEPDEASGAGSGIESGERAAGADRAETGRDERSGGDSDVGDLAGGGGGSGGAGTSGGRDAGGTAERDATRKRDASRAAKSRPASSGLDQRTVKVRPPVEEKKGEPKPNRTRRKTGVARQAQITEESGLWGNVFDGLFWAISKFRGKHWELDEEELVELSEKTAEAINRSLPDEWVKKYNERLKQASPVMASIAVAGAILYERIETDRAIATTRKARGVGQGNGRRPTDYPSRHVAQIPDSETNGAEGSGGDSEIVG